MEKKKILLLNVGSSTIKWAFFINNKKIFGKEERLSKLADYDHAFMRMAEKIQIFGKPEVIIHRIVHGKDISKPQIITTQLLKKLDSIAKLAPLHDIPEIVIIRKSMKRFQCKQIAVFDTSFYTAMPELAKMYGLPYNLYKQGIKRYGFHGLSHESIANKAEKILGKNKKIISCHLGAGCSITAIKGKKPLDTSMGFTPLEGVLMATRSGSIDPSIVLYLEKEKRMSISQINDLLNRKSGLLGISGKKDFRELLNLKSEKSRLALDLFCYMISKQIASYIPVLGGLDAIVFTAGIGENNPAITAKIIRNLDFFKNKLKFKVLVIKTDEFEIMLSKAEKLIN